MNEISENVILKWLDIQWIYQQFSPDCILTQRYYQINLNTEMRTNCIRRCRKMFAPNATAPHLIFFVCCVFALRIIPISQMWFIPFAELMIMMSVWLLRTKWKGYMCPFPNIPAHLLFLHLYWIMNSIWRILHWTQIIKMHITQYT